MPFRLLYGEEAVTLEEIKKGSLGTTASSEEDQSALKDLMEIDRLEAVLNLEKYQEETRKRRDKKVLPRKYIPGDFMLIKTPRTEGKGKLEPKWKGPFIVSKARNPASYRLTTLDGEVLQHPWHADNLHKYYL